MSNIGKVYKTKIGEPSMFKVEAITSIGRAIGYYVGNESLGLCPLPIERLYSEEIPFKEMFNHWVNERAKRMGWKIEDKIKELEAKYSF